ncbi:hypothetical protein EXN32_11930 [Agrobacterium tumefaciens]|uniref:Riorf95 protein n=2 Tax=Rhizobium/Agrobacterium group TaxID=227290 RepID=Q9F5F5_RHIRH|nr:MULTISPECIES: hypothetical protein [Rhizobium/Agrobacterium group]ASK42978.1 hypothetical protein [Rhizobium rhizogenes]MCZ7977384.1 hypothetical protein [Agrobacterium salinitolerans]MDA5243193.1 hypothetical protein [Agrobacterium sp. MAFF310724]MDA5247625.1 hypothetical protein [Agrobacterium sp. MAFF210268]TRB03292.1 hypothetical protein EXN61_23545 [Agrobacterium tumefaciens]
MRTSDLQHEPASTSEDLSVEFGVSADGFPVARIADTLLAMVPARDGASFLASAWRLTRPLSALTREDFHCHEGRLEDEAAFRTRVFETARHSRELSALGRNQTRMAANTPWGPSQLATIYAEGIVSHMTAGHGGFHLSAERNACVLPMLRKSSPWYEEDAEWAIVAHTFPDLFTAYERKCADETIRNSWPSAWEAIHCRELAPGQSWTKDRQAFERRHAGDWVVISAIFSSHHADMTEVVASRGGRRDGRAQEIRFLVPRAEYAARDRFGFVIDPDRHGRYDGPSSFAGWQRRVA